MALRAIRAQPAAVRILVAGHAILGQAEPRAGQILDLDLSPLRGENIRWRVALGALDLRVLSFQNISRLAVVEGIDRPIPVNQIEVRAVMFRVALGAFLAVGRVFHQGGVQPAMVPQSLRDLHMAFHAFQFPGRDAQRMTARALRRPTQGLMGFGQRPRGKLCVQWGNEKEQQKTRREHLHNGGGYSFADGWRVKHAVTGSGISASSSSKT